MAVTRKASDALLKKMFKDEGALKLVNAMRIQSEAIIDYGDEKFDEHNSGSVLLTITLMGLISSAIYSYIDEDEWKNASVTVGEDIYKTILDMKKVMEKMKFPEKVKFPEIERGRMKCF